jgi:hypothetical protein
MSDIEADLLLLRLGLGVGMAEGVAWCLGDWSSCGGQSSLSIRSVCSFVVYSVYSSSVSFQFVEANHTTIRHATKTRDNSG